MNETRHSIDDLEEVSRLLSSNGFPELNLDTDKEDVPEEDYRASDGPSKASTRDNPSFRLWMGRLGLPIVLVCVNLLHWMSSSHTREDFSPPAVAEPFYCEWAPGQNEACAKPVSELICREETAEQQDKIPRMVLLGDSTMHRFWNHMKRSFVEPALSTLEQADVAMCSLTVKHPKDQRCNIAEQLGYTKPTNWMPPPPGLGPIYYGLNHTGCADCKSCGPALVDCQRPTNSSFSIQTWTRQELTTLVYGSFLTGEFARDVVVQTTEFPTTQESMANYIRQNFNRPDLLQIFQAPTCFVNTGHHDAAIPDMTQEMYLEHVGWYLHLLSDVCQSIIWLATTAPKTDDYPQKKQQTKEWGEGVRSLIFNDDVLRSKALYMDIYEASLSFEHVDNIHMVGAWYEALSDFYSPERFVCS